VASPTEYVSGQVPAGGPVKTSASSNVRSDTTCRGTTPISDTDDRVEPSNTGRRPTWSIARTACQSSAEDDVPKTTNAADCPQRPRTTGANDAAVHRGDRHAARIT
jgi:hypothetical protein